MLESRTRVILMDRATAPSMLAAAATLPWSVTLLSVGREPVTGTVHYTQMLTHDAEGIRIS
jgi:hypothetical protein